MNASGLEPLAELSELHEVYVGEGRISDADVERLQAIIPGAKLFRGRGISE